MQTKRESLLEAKLNTFSGLAVGYSITLLVNWLSPITLFGYTLIDLDISHETAIWWTILMTVVSITRNYIWRRLFNKKKKTEYVFIPEKDFLRITAALERDKLPNKRLRKLMIATKYRYIEAHNDKS